MGTLPPAIPSSIAGIAEIAGVVHSDPNDRNDYMETRLNKVFKSKISVNLVNHLKQKCLHISPRSTDPPKS